MKIQCHCGAKYAFDVTPEMASQPFTLVCQTCNVDLSSAVQPLIQQALAELRPTPPASAPPRPAPIAVPVPSVARPAASAGGSHAAPIQPPSGAGSARLNKPAVAAPSEAPPPGPSAPQARCHRHPSVLAAEECKMCGKAMCPQCMTQFGYVCSAYCQTRAENLGVEIPEFAGQYKNTSARFAKLFKLGMAGTAVVLLLLFGLWAANEFYFSKPHPAASITFSSGARYSQGRWANDSSVIVLRDGKLSRVDAKTGQAVWENEIVKRSLYEGPAREQGLRERAEYARWYERRIRQGPRLNEFGNPIYIEPVPTEAEAIQERLDELLAEAWSRVELMGTGTAIWVGHPDKLAYYQFSDGAETKTVPVPGGNALHQRDGHRILSVGRIDNGDVKMAWTEVGTGAVEEKVFPQAEAAAAASAATRGATNTNVRSGAASAGNTRSRGNELDGFRPGMSGPEALITAIGIRANNRWNQAMEDDPEMGARKRHPQLTDQSGSRWAPSPEGALKFSRQLKEFKPVLRKTMEDAPTKSALEGPVGQAQTAKVANEVLNEMRRENTGGVEVDDKSIYLAKLELHKPTGAPVKWESDVTSPPEVTVLSSLILLMADTTIHVFDANLRKLWQTQLAYPMDRAASGWSLGGNDEGIAITEPMIERGDTLYLIDPGSLGAYDKVTGAAKWRLPSVGISRLIFDEQGNIFIDTTTMGQQQLRLTDQIDIGRKDRRVVMKVVAASGKVLWRTENCGSIAALEGKYVYSSETVTSGGGPLNPDAIPVTQLLICRLHHKSGKLLWEHASRGYPESVDFLNNQFLILRTNRLDVIRFGMF